MPSNKISIIEYFSLEAPFATECRRLLYNIQHARDDRESELKALLITSSMLSEGKSTISALLAMTAARKNIKTVIIDIDLRRPAIHKLFGLEREIGLVEYLTEDTPTKNIIKKTSLDNLDIITAGKITAHPSEVFNAASLGRLIEELKYYYDLIVIDSPPIVPVSDPLFLAQEVDGVLLVIKAGDTQREVIKRAVDIMNSNNNKLIGIIMNNVSDSLPYYYDYSYHGYQYDQKPSDIEKKNPRNNDKSSKKKSDKSGTSALNRPGNDK